MSHARGSPVGWGFNDGTYRFALGSVGLGVTIFATCAATCQFLRLELRQILFPNLDKQGQSSKGSMAKLQALQMWQYVPSWSQLHLRIVHQG